MHVVNPSIIIFHVAGLRVSFAVTGRACYRTDAVPRRRPRRRTLSTWMARRGGDENHRVPLGDITNTQKLETGSNKRSRELEGGEYCTTTCPCPYLSKPLIVQLCLLDADLTAVRRQKARERYANLPPEKKAELNAKKRENYHRRQAEKRSAGQLHVVKFIMKFKCPNILYDA